MKDKYFNSLEEFIIDMITSRTTYLRFIDLGKHQVFYCTSIAGERFISIVDEEW